jgi:hypothetical protein
MYFFQFNKLFQAIGRAFFIENTPVTITRQTEYASMNENI